MTLSDFFAAHPKAALAFSGGVDSAFLLWAARTYGCDVRAYYVHSAFQPAFELKDAERLAEELVARLTIELEASGRHVHLSRADVETLFGAGYRLNRTKDLSQPGQFACAERVTLAWPRGS